MRHFISLLALAGTLTAQGTLVPMPAFSQTNVSTTKTTGFWFQAPAGAPFLIKGLRVPDEFGNGFQSVEVFKFASAPPVAPATASGGSVFYAALQDSSIILPTNILVNPGDFVGVLGACGDSVAIYNSYGPLFVPTFTTNILGNTVTLNRFVTPTKLATSGGDQPYSSELTTVGRVEMYVEPAVMGLVPSCSADVQVGPSPLTVQFTDTSLTDDPNGVVGWVWDLDGDGIPDSNFQNPSFTYHASGIYDVTLTVVDTLNPAATTTKTAFIIVDPTLASYSFHKAAGCVGSAGPVTLTGFAGSTPKLGTTFTAQLAGMPPSTGALMYLGYNDVMAGPFALPLDLTPFGLAGCVANVEAFDSYLVLGDPAGVGTWSLSIPNDLSLMGATFYNQALVIDPASATAVGAVVSDSAIGVAGL